MIATLSSTRALRRDEIKLNVELITPLLHVRGYAAPETRAAVERARALIERSRELGELPEDPLLLYAVLYGLWVANLVAFNLNDIISWQGKGPAGRRGSVHQRTLLVPRKSHWLSAASRV